MTTLRSPYDTEDWDGPYAVAINGQECWVWREFDVDESWWLATVRPMALANRILAEHGVRERFHLHWAGANDGSGYLLDPAVDALMRESGLFGDRELVWLPERLLEANGVAPSA